MWRIIYNGAAKPSGRWQVTLQNAPGFFSWRRPFPADETPPCFHAWRLGPLVVARFTRLAPWT